MALDLSFRHDRWFRRLSRSPRDSGTVSLCVVRTGPGLRETPPALRVEPGRGVLGDAWAREEQPVAGAEVALVNVHVLRAIAGSEERLPLAGDNLVVDLELGEENLPIGTRLRIGEDVVLQVSTVPHRPCGRFVRRFGALAAKRVARANRRGLRGRGVLCTVVRGGGIRVGDAIRVERCEAGS